MVAPCVYFDLDGVLVDSRPGIIECVNATLAAFGFAQCRPERIEQIIGPPLREGFAELLAEVGGSAGDIPACVAAYRKRYATVATDGGTILQRGIAEMLDRISSRAVLAVATSKPHRFAEPILVSLGIRQAFRVVVGPTPETDGETKTQTLARAIAEIHGLGFVHGASPSFMIGDRHYDMRAAVACATVPIGCGWGYGSEAELLAAGAAFIVRDATELAPLVERLSDIG